MRLELCNQSKYRQSGRLGDDVPLVVPGRVYGVFDGATDPRGTMVGPIGAGRLAAVTVAEAVSRLAHEPDGAERSTEAIIAYLSDALQARTGPMGLPIPPSTTVAIVLDCGDQWRFITLGDTGIRLNGTEVLRHEKLIDTVSTLGRVAVFNHLAGKADDLDEVEKTARQAILLGFDHAVGAGVIDQSLADAITQDTIERTGLQAQADTVRAFLAGGIQTQFRFGNATGSVLCFDTMNGTMPVLGETRDLRRSKADIRSIEIFSDGYVDMPERACVTAWESLFEQTENEDFHKTGRYAGVKGSTRDEVFDDRTVIVLRDL